MRPKTLALAAVATGAAVALPALALRRWGAAEDPTGGEALGDIDGERFSVPLDDGTELVGVAGGEGPDVVLVHGWTNDRRIWRAVGQRLIDTGHRVITYDARGHGESHEGAVDHSLPRLAADLRAVLEHVGAKGATVVGHSMGGMTAQTLVTSDPSVTDELMSSLVLVATACHGVTRGSPRLDAIAVRVVSGPVTRRIMSRPVAGLFTLRNGVGEVVCRSHLTAMRETFAGTAPSALSGCLTGMQEMDLREALESIEIPVTVVAGRKDQLTPMALSEEIARRIPHCRLEVLDRIGHMIQLEAPDTLARLITDSVPVLEQR